MDLPEELSRREQRLVAIAKAKAEIERRAAERHALEQQAYEKKLDEREKKATQSGKKPRGKNIKPPIPGPSDKDQVNLTDSESRIMPKGKGFEQAYNAQICVDADSLLVVSHGMSSHCNDKAELKPMLTTLAELPSPLGSVGNLLADSGYFSEENVRACIEAKIQPYIAPGREEHNLSAFERFAEPTSPCPDATSDPVGAMRHRLRTKAGKALYRLRKSTVEPVIGIIKSILGLREFSFRGAKLVSSEWGIVCTAWNIKRLHCMIQAS